LSTRPEIQASKVASAKGSDCASPTAKRALAAGSCARACATKARDGSIPTTAEGDASSSTVVASAPVPEPTSSHDASAGTASQSTNSFATSRLQRPMYASYLGPLAQTFAGTIALS
jgi:hypothetical protein